MIDFIINLSIIGICRSKIIEYLEFIVFLSFGIINEINTITVLEYMKYKVVTDSEFC